jgi:tetratricopeptide (TPR) repeat protein
MRTLKMTSCACLLLANLAGMADNTTGIALYESGIYGASKVYFLKKVNDATIAPEEKAEAYYYLGESYFMLNKPDSARFYFEKGLETLPTDPYNQIALGGFVLQEDVKRAEALFKEIVSGRLYKKDMNVYLAVARAYIHAGNTAKAMEYIENAKRVGHKDGHPFLLEGDLLRSQRQLGEAATKYDHAIHFSPELIGAYVKTARIYMASNSNRELSMSKLMEVKQFAPEFTGVDCVIGELYEIQGDAKKAVEHYSRFIEAGYYDVEHLLRYAGILHFDKQYDKVLPIIIPVLEKTPDNLVAKRLYAYVLSETGGEKSIDAIKHFIETTPEERHIVRDYRYYADQLVANDQLADAIPYYGKIVQRDSTQKSLWETMGDLFVRINRRDSAARYFALYETTLPSPNLQLIFKMGQNLYQLGLRDSVPESQAVTMHKADSVFARLSELAPTSLLSYLLRGRIQLTLDPDVKQELGKQFYEKVVELALENPERYKNQLVESYRYLGYYYYQLADAITRRNNDNMEPARAEWLKAKEYFAKILQLIPGDKQATEGFNGITIQ